MLSFFFGGVVGFRVLRYIGDSLGFGGFGIYNIVFLGLRMKRLRVWGWRCIALRLLSAAAATPPPAPAARMRIAINNIK